MLKATREPLNDQGLYAGLAATWSPTGSGTISSSHAAMRALVELETADVAGRKTARATSTIISARTSESITGADMHENHHASSGKISSLIK